MSRRQRFTRNLGRTEGHGLKTLTTRRRPSVRRCWRPRARRALCGRPRGRAAVGSLGFQSGSGRCSLRVRAHQRASGARHAGYAARTRFQDELELKPNVALRKGELAVHGWRVRDAALREIARTPRALVADDLELNLEQKGVDLRIGLDIARLALRRLVETLVVVTGDSDLVPAFQFARREGLRVFLDHLGGPVKRELEAHADPVL